jgi:hypothetical protein
MLDTYSACKHFTKEFIDWIVQSSDFLLSVTTSFQSGSGRTLFGLKLRVQVIVNCQAKFEFQQNQLFADIPKVFRSALKAIEYRSKVISFYSARITLPVDLIKEKSIQSLNSIIDFLIESYDLLNQWYSQFIPSSPETNEINEDSDKDDIIDRKIEIESAKDQFDILFNLDPSDGNNSRSGSFHVVERKMDENDTDCLPHLPMNIIVEDEKSNFCFEQNDRTINEMDNQFGDLKLYLLCYLLDLREISERVKDVWIKVKQQKVSSLTAIMLSYLALLEVRALEYRKRKQYPIWKSSAFHFFMAMFEKSFPRNEFEGMYKTRVLHEFEAISEILYHFQSSTFGDYSHTPLKNRCYLCKEVGCDPNLPSYPFIEINSLPLKNEEAAYARFLNAELVYLYNYIISLAVSSHPQDTDPNASEIRTRKVDHLSLLFLETFKFFFRTGVITMELVFTCWVWIKTVQILQDSNSLFLMKTIYVLKHSVIKRSENINSFDLVNMIMTLLSSTGSDVEEEGKCLVSSLLSARRPFHQTISDTGGNLLPLFQNNPFLCGSAVLFSILQDVKTCVKIIDKLTASSSPIVLICYLYCCLRNEGFLEEKIDFIERFLLIFPVVDKSKIVFPRNCWSYYLTIKNTKLSDLLSINQYISSTSSSSMNDLLVLFYLTENWGLKVFPLGSFTFYDGLTSMEELMEREMFQTRSLSMDSLVAFQHFYDLVEMMKSNFTEMQLKFHSTLVSVSSHLTSETPVVSASSSLLNETSEFAIMFPILRVLDMLPALRDHESRCLVSKFCDLMKNFYKNNKNIAEDQLFIFPALVSNSYVKEFGRAAMKVEDEFEGEIDETSTVSSSFSNGSSDPSGYLTAAIQFNLFEFTQHTIDSNCFTNAAFSSLKSNFKEAVKANPLVLKHYQPMGASAKGLSTFLDYALLGKNIKDYDLAEWIVAMGGFVMNHSSSLHVGMTKFSVVRPVVVAGSPMVIPSPPSELIPSSSPSTSSDSSVNQSGLSLFSSSEYSHLQLVCMDCDEKEKWQIQLLLAITRGLAVNYQDPADGNTALHYISLQNNLSFLKELRLCLPDYQLKNLDGKTPLDVCTSLNSQFYLLLKELSEKPYIPDRPYHLSFGRLQQYYNSFFHQQKEAAANVSLVTRL